MKTLKRILFGILAVIAILILFISISIYVDSFFDRGRMDDLANLSVPGVNGDPDVHAYVARPAGKGPFPTVIMIHEFFGLNESIVSKAGLLAQEGYVVIAPDTFRGATTSFIPRAIYLVVTSDFEAVNADLDSVHAWLKTQPGVDQERIAILGFCYGGRVSLQYSLHNDKLAATVVFYGSPETDPDVLKNLPGPLLGIFGGADQSISSREVHDFENGLSQAGVPHQITIYDGQPHAFVEDARGILSGGAQAEAWNEMLLFLEDNLKDSTSHRDNKGVSDYSPSFPWKYYLALAYEHALGPAGHGH